MCSEKFKENVEMMDGVNYMVEHLVAVETVVEPHEGQYVP
jgi:hypothetical protein